MKNASLLLLSSLLVSANALAEASFEGAQNGVSRNSFDLFGGAAADLAIDSAGRVYAAMNAPNGAFCLDSGATEWRDPPAGVDMGSVQGVALGSTAGTAFVIGGTSLFRTTDGCLTWSELTGSSGSAESNDYGFKLIFGHSTLLVEARNATLDRSADNGATFSSVAVAAGAQGITALAASPTAGEFYALVNMGGGSIKLYRSTDAGQNWSDTGKAGAYSDVAVDGADAMRIALSTDSDGVELSIDGGATWSPLTPPDTSKKRVKFINGRLFKGNAFTDNTTTWSQLGESAGGADIVAPVAGDPTNPALLYVGTELGIARSTDSGSTFTDINSGIFAVSVQDIAQGSDKNIVYLATEQGLAKTVNFLSEDGPSWSFPVAISPTRAYQGVYSVHMDRADPSRLYAGLLGGELYYSVDAGASWTAAVTDAIGGADIPDIAETDDGTLYAAYRSRENNSGGVLRSTDNGANWSIVSAGGVSIDCNAIAVIGNTIFVAAGDDRDQSNTASGIYRYDGTTWSKLTGAVDGQIVMDVVTAGGTLISASAADSDASGGVFRSTDSGATWQDVSDKGLRESGAWYRTLAVDPGNEDIIFVAHGRPAGPAEIYHSQDRGATWALMYEGLTDEVPAAMLVDDLTIGSGVGFTGISVADDVKLDAKIRSNKLECTLKSGTAKLSGRPVSWELKGKRGFTRKKTKLTASSGKAVFPLGKTKPGARVRCRFITELSRIKKVQ